MIADFLKKRIDAKKVIGFIKEDLVIEFIDNSLYKLVPSRWLVTDIICRQYPTIYESFDSKKEAELFIKNFPITFFKTD